MSNRSNNVAEQRLCRLLDENSFMEIGSLMTARSTDFNLSDTATPSDGVITGHGLIDGNLVFVYSQDASVLKGTIGEVHAKKIAAVYDRAMKMGAPVIGFLDCAGVRLQESVDALDALGMIYEKQVMASGVIPQICAVFGNCGGGLTVVPGLCDFVFMESDKAKMFVNSPNAIDGNRIEKCDTSSSSFQSQETGIIDMAGTEDEIYASIRALVTMLPSDNTENGYLEDCTDDLNRACQSMETMKGDARYILGEISDDHVFFETRREYGKNMVTGFIRLNGLTVGTVANSSERYDEEGKLVESFHTVLNAKGCDKAAEFIQFCDAFDIPVLSVTNVTGFCTCACSEKKLAKALSRLTYAFANATVPKVNLVVDKAYGSAAVMMNSKSVGADMVYAWPGAKMGTMDAKLAAGIMYADADADKLDEKAKEYDALQSSIETAARRGYVDLIIDPADTRKYLVAAFEMLFTKRMDTPYKKHGAK
ncbi:MAG: carboxyl transferase [Lachnospiraceae bacterium]|nr:carboxyl transferase [Lachnospiraceae bacterium]